MTRRVIPEWSGEELVYVGPSQVILSFGYNNYHPGRVRTEIGAAAIANARQRVGEADGPVASDKRQFSGAPEATELVKSQALEMGAELVGVTHVDPHHVYKGEDLPHRFAVVIAHHMDFEKLMQTPSSTSSDTTLATYDVLGGVATNLASLIRSLGYPARAHTLQFEQLNMLPHAYAAGLGELGKHGSLINKEFGSSFRVAVVTTDIPLVTDSPRNDGIHDFCKNCQMCVNYCPGDAISDEQQEVRGTVKWVVDTEACAPYWGTYYACGICLQVCPYNARGFDGKYRADFVKMIKGIDRESWMTELREGLQEQWAFVEPPVVRDEGWRQRVKGRNGGPDARPAVSDSSPPKIT